MSDTNLYISKIVAPDGNTYYIKDTEARNMLSQGLEIKVVTTLPTAEASTMGKLYMVQDNSHNPSSGSGWKDYYDEYITVNPSGTTYQWEKIGNTDVNLSSFSHVGHTHTVDISVYRHSYTPAGTITDKSFSGTAATISVSGTPSGTVTTNQTTNKTATVSPTSGNTTYTPAGEITADFNGTSSTITLSGTANGSISGTTGAGGAHHHSVTRTVKYLHTVSVPTSFKSKTVLEDVSKCKLTTRSMRSVTNAIEVTAVKNVSDQTGVAIASTGNTSVSYVTKGTGSVTVDSSMGGAVVGVSTGATTTQGGNNVMWNAVVDSATETLSFVFKPLDTSNFVTKSSATTTANTVTINTFGTRLISSSTTLKKFDSSTISNVAIASTGTVAFATGALSASTATSNVGSLIAVPGGPTASVFYDTSSTSSVYNTVNTTADGGTAVITSVNTTTGDESAHTHSVSIGLSNGAISVSGSYTPVGNIRATFDGSSVRLVTGNIPVPSSYTFSGSNSTFTGSYTPAGTISANFSGTAATLTHTIYGASTGYKRLTTSTDDNP